MKCREEKNQESWAKASAEAAEDMSVRAQWALVVPGGLGRSLLEEEEEGEWGGQWEFDYSRR